MATVTEILQIVQLIAKIIEALRDMGLKVTGEVSVADIMKLIPKT